MKSLLQRSLLLLPLIAVIVVNGLYFPENGKEQLELKLRNSVNTTTAEPSGGDCESNGGECKKNKKQCKTTISTEFTCSSKGVCCIAEVNAQGASELMLEMLSNTILIQGMAMETLKEDQENSMSNLTNIIVNLKQTVEIKNSNLSDAISNQGMALQINQDRIMSNLTDGFSDQENNQNSMTSNLTSLSESLNQLINDVDSKISNLTNLIKRQGCPRDFFILAHQCYKLYNDTRRSWTSAKSKCESVGLRMAEIDNPIPLMDILVTTLGVNSYTWLGAKGDGSYVRWQSSNKVVPSGSSNYWHYYSTSSSYCMMILSSSTSYRLRPFYANTCTTAYNTLCEYV